MDWRVKAMAQKVLSGLPGGGALNYVLQERVTHSVPQSDVELANKLDMARRQVEAIQAHTGKPASELAIYEFGAGWELTIPMARSLLGVGRQVVTDVVRGARAHLVMDAHRRLARRLGAAEPHGHQDLAEYLADQRIEYLAPRSAEETGLPTSSFDCVTSTSVLEHVRPGQLPGILRECSRLVNERGVVYLFIDFNDHFGYFDDSISYSNFLQYSERRWSLYNSSLHYQSRLRMSDYLRLLDETGLLIVALEHDGPRPRETDGLRALRLAEPFLRYSTEDLLTQNATVVCRPVA